MNESTATHIAGRAAPLALALAFACLAGTGAAHAGTATAGDRAGQIATLSWHDGAVQRQLLIDPARVADFRSDPAGAARAGPVLRSRGAAEKATDALAAGVSPVFTEAGAPGRLRALPGGVIVVLKPAPAGEDAAGRAAQARRQLQSAGLEPVRPIGPGGSRWLVASPAGLPALELANRLHDSGEFESAAPNWWQPRAKK